MKLIVTVVFVFASAICSGQNKEVNLTTDSIAIVGLSINKADTAVRIRFHCQASIIKASEPLLYLDGIRIRFMDIQDVNPDFIEKVEVIKEMMLGKNMVEKDVMESFL